MRSTACREHMLAASSSSNKDDLSLGADQEEPPTLIRNATSSNVVSQRINSPSSTMHIGRTTFQCKFVSVLVFFNYNIIYEQVINIS
jgi:hypothetical protein